MVQVKLQPLVADALDHLGEIAVQALVGHALVVEGRQHQHAGAAELDRGARHLDRVAERAVAGARHQAEAGTPPLTSFSNRCLFSETDIEFASLLVPNTARPDAAALQQPLAVAHEALRVGRVVLAERRDDGRQHALDALHLAD